MKKDFLLEIGTEEIPARFIEEILYQLKELFIKEIKEQRIDCNFSSITTYATPRRLVITALEVVTQQQPLVKEYQGPAVNIAFDKDKNPTKAAYGFAKSYGVKLEKLITKKTPKGEYLFYVKEEKGKKTLNCLSEILPKIITNIFLPTTMYWEKSKIKFIRPIRWLLALLGEKIVDFNLGSIRSNRISFGHRFLAPLPIKIKFVNEYFQKLEENFVLYDHHKRKELIKKKIERIAFKKKVKVLEDEDLLNKITFLTEYPEIIWAKFNPQYLDLPEEVLIETMKKHLYSFPVKDNEEKLLPYFISVINTKSSPDIITGNEKVLDSRLKDAKFYFEEDKKNPLEKRVEELKKIFFLEKLGTLYEKTERIKKISNYLALKFQPEVASICNKIAYLCKADLTTLMVKEKEYVNLHGIMGRKYALLSNEKEEIAQGIFEYTLPRYPGDILPQSLPAALVSLSDKIDTITGCFILNLIPTGSLDPHGNRRLASGIIEIIVKHHLNIDLNDLIKKIIEVYKEKLKREFLFDEALIEKIIDFFIQRLKTFLLEKKIRYDIINAVLAVEKTSPLIIINKTYALSKIFSEDISLAISFSRIKNIIKDQKIEKFDYQRLKEKEEKNLFNQYKKIKEEEISFINNFKYKEAMELLLTLKKPIDDFFDNILVMTEDKFLRINRLSLLNKIASLFLKIADFSKIVTK